LGSLVYCETVFTIETASKENPKSQYRNPNKWVAG
jgi:hypothetical protein